MKRLFMFAVILGLLVVMSGNVVRADGDPDDPVPLSHSTVKVMNSDPDDPVPVFKGVVVADDVTLNSPPGSDITPDHKATPVVL